MQPQQELSASTKQLGSCQSSQQLSQLRDTATMMYLEVVQKNYGKAGEYSREVFDQAQQIASSTVDPALRNVLRDTLATRDQITADLAKGGEERYKPTDKCLSAFPAPIGKRIGS